MDKTVLISLPIEEFQLLIVDCLNSCLNQPAKEQSNPDELLTVQDTAKFLSLSVPTIYGLISKGELPVMKRSKRCYFSKVEILNYLKQGRRKTVAETDKEAQNYLNRKGR